MPFQVSPGVNISEIDLTTVTPAVSSTEGAIAGVFRWGPVDTRILVDSETTLVNRFGKPSNFNSETFFTAANFLSYGNKLYVVRAANTTLTTGSASITTAAITGVTGSGTAAVYTANNAGGGIAVGDLVTITGMNPVEYNITSAPVTAANSTTFTVASAVTTTFISGGTVSAILPPSQYSAWNAVANVGAITSRTAFVIKNQDDFDQKDSDGTLATDTDVYFVAKWPGALGNSLKVSICDSTNAYSSVVNLVSNTWVSTNTTLTNATITVGSNTAVVKLANAVGSNVANVATVATSIIGQLTVGDVVQVGNSSIGRQYLKISAVDASPTTNATHAFFTVSFDGTYNLAANLSQQSVTRYWEFFNSVDDAPGTSQYVTNFGNTAAVDEMHVAVIDEDGEFTGVPGTVLELFERVSRATDAKTSDGATNYFKTVINAGSQYIWAVNDRANAVSNSALNVASSLNTKPLTMDFVDGTDGPDESSVVFGDLTRAYDQFASAESVDISLLLTGKSRGGTNGEQLANYLIDNVAEVRRDCVVFISPDRADVVRNVGTEASSIVTFRNSLRSSSYAVLDSGYKYQYDKYNDVYRFVPLNGDTAGLCVRTDDTRDPWFSPAGFNRGQIKNIVKLAYNPNKADRDILYKAGVNPVVTFPGQGTILFGDKTLLARPSAFDRINVRRLFIVLEKAISTAAKSLLFEFNDEFTRSQFKNLVEPFLRDVQGRRGITAFKVVCDDSNNTAQVIDSNQFVGDIYIKPARSINFIQLNFVAVRTGVEFSEIVGQF